MVGAYRSAFPDAAFTFWNRSAAGADAAAPGPIAWATYAGRRYAEELDAPDLGDALSFRREIAALQPGLSLLP